jgi:hypothetical protein
MVELWNVSQGVFIGFEMLSTFLPRTSNRLFILGISSFARTPRAKKSGPQWQDPDSVGFVSGKDRIAEFNWG